MTQGLHAGWYVFYDEPGETTVQTTRIASDCLGNALAAAGAMAERCGITLVGVTPDLGVREGAPQQTHKLGLQFGAEVAT